MNVNFLQKHDGCHFDASALQFVLMDIAAQIGRKIRSLRRTRMPEMTIEDLADKSGLTRQTIGNIETGRHKQVALTTILAIASALGVKIDELLTEMEPLAGVAEKQAEYGKEGSSRRLRTRQASTGTAPAEACTSSLEGKRTILKGLYKEAEKRGKAKVLRQEILEKILNKGKRDIHPKKNTS